MLMPVNIKVNVSLFLYAFNHLPILDEHHSQSLPLLLI
jgi:hypothetical protein